jgi:regulator of protease activity HflC (stomatin/prohibitin superfamily)
LVDQLVKHLIPRLSELAAPAVVVVAGFMCFTTVPPGHSGVVVTMGRVSDNVLSDGLHFKLPWQNVILLDNRAQKRELTTQAFSSDIQQVDVDCSVNFSVDRDTCQRLYQTVGVAYYETVMLPRVLENLKAIFSNYSAEDLVGAREDLSKQILGILAPEMKAYGIEVLSIAIENMDFTDAFTDAVEAKQVAEQTKLKTQIQQSEQLLIEQTNAERAKITANASAEVARINAAAKAYSVRTAAEAEAEANTLLAESVTEQLIEYVKANGWDGKLPQFMGGTNDMLPVLNLEGDAGQ